MLQVRWASFKAFLDSRNATLHEFEDDNHYHLIAIDRRLQITCKVPFDEATEYEADYQAFANPTMSDQDGRDIVLPSVAPEGWHYQYLVIEVETSKLSSIYCKDKDGSNLTTFTQSFYNGSGVQLVAGTQAELDSNCVETRFTFEPPFDYSIIQGALIQKTTPTNDLRFWCVGAPDISEASGGSVVFAQGMNLSYYQEKTMFRTDGRVAKRLIYDATYHINKLGFYLKHDVGLNHKINFIIELYKA